MNRRGRRATLPLANYRPQERVISAGDTCTVRFLPENGDPSVIFNFGVLPVHHDLQAAFASAFDKRCGPLGSRRTVKSASITFQSLRMFAVSCSLYATPPKRPDEITRAVLDSHILRRVAKIGWAREVSDLRCILRLVDGISSDVIEALLQHRAVKKSSPLECYSPNEQRGIERAARRDLRAAADRIRRAAEVLERWRSSEIDRTTEPSAWERGWLLDQVARTGEISADVCALGPSNYSADGTKSRDTSLIADVLNSLFLTRHEVAAACALLIALTGMNGGTLARAPSTHHRADGAAGGPPIAIIRLEKPRRGRRLSQMDFPLTDLPPRDTMNIREAEASEARKGELATPFGLYNLLLELASVAREIAHSHRLFLWADAIGTQINPRAVNIREDIPANSVPTWGRHAAIRSDTLQVDGTYAPVHVTMTRLRLTFLQRYQTPVAHGTSTLADDYLIRDRGATLEYQRVVAEALAEQVERAHNFPQARVLFGADETAAQTDPRGVAERTQVSEEVLKRILAGELNTVMAACADNLQSSYSEHGKPCEASFLMCLGCACARISQQHIPFLLAMRETLENRRMSMTPLAWTLRFAAAFTLLDEILSRFAIETVKSAKLELNDQHYSIVRQLLDHELDVL
jgi:hypothetical protein